MRGTGVRIRRVRHALDDWPTETKQMNVQRHVGRVQVGMVPTVNQYISIWSIPNVCSAVPGTPNLEPGSCPGRCHRSHLPEGNTPRIPGKCCWSHSSPGCYKRRAPGKMHQPERRPQTLKWRQYSHNTKEKVPRGIQALVT